MVITLLNLLGAIFGIVLIVVFVWLEISSQISSLRGAVLLCLFLIIWFLAESMKRSQ